MNKITKIAIQESYKILCSFKNGENRLFDVEQSLAKDKKYTNKILSQDVFNKVKVGSLGELYWDGVAEMKDLHGNMISCEYDICPDFVYMHSELVGS